MSVGDERKMRWNGWTDLIAVWDVDFLGLYLVGARIPHGKGTFGDHTCACPDLPAVNRYSQPYLLRDECGLLLPVHCISDSGSTAILPCLHICTCTYLRWKQLICLLCICAPKWIKRLSVCHSVVCQSVWCVCVDVKMLDGMRRQFTQLLYEMNFLSDPNPKAAESNRNSSKPVWLFHI